MNDLILFVLGLVVTIVTVSAVLLVSQVDPDSSRRDRSPGEDDAY